MSYEKKDFLNHEAHEEHEGINQKHKKCYQLEYSILPSREGCRGVFFLILLLYGVPFMGTQSFDFDLLNLKELFTMKRMKNTKAKIKSTNNVIKWNTQSSPLERGAGVCIFLDLVRRALHGYPIL